ncbi:MAG: DUF58 domain-containing protein [Deltaproteobacteria bacterium]|nr:DUF58 domain-containing protein [Deltaproteobacteria bacterium]
MIYPTTLHIALWVLLSMIGLLDFFLPGIAPVWQISVAVLVGVSLLDGLLSLRRPPLKLQRTVHHSLPVTAWSKVKLKIANEARYPLSLRIHDHCHPDFRVQDQPNSFSLAKGHSATVVYQVFPSKRGHYTFPGADILVHSPLRLWQKKWYFPCANETKVFPNFREISHYVLLATHHHLSMMGIRKLTKRGEGKEFHQLREYRKGDELQKIDWKATSRYRRLISKEYQDERDQQIVFVLDCGRRMRHMENGKSQLDQTLNSILLLAYVAVRQGDGVGLYSFGGTEKWLPPRKQEDSVRSLMLGMYDIESSTNASDYLRATQDLLKLQNRRSLMVIITNSRAEDHEDLLIMTRQLRRKHLVVIANLRENILDETLSAPINGFTEAARYQALQDYLTKRQKLHRQLQHLGIYALDVTAQQLPAAIVNTYLEIKNTGKL